jgi:DNA-binding beta-propeller fold protein YncE
LERAPRKPLRQLCHEGEIQTRGESKAATRLLLRQVCIDTATNKTTNWIELPAPAFASAPTPDGRWLPALSMVANRLFVVDLQTGKVTRSLEVPKRSSEILIRPGGEIAYISGTGAGKIAVLGLRSWEMQRTIRLTPGVDGLAWVPAPR